MANSPPPQAVSLHFHIYDGTGGQVIPLNRKKIYFLLEAVLPLEFAAQAKAIPATVLMTYSHFYANMRR